MADHNSEVEPTVDDLWKEYMNTAMWDDDVEEIMSEEPPVDRNAQQDRDSDLLEPLGDFPPIANTAVFGRVTGYQQSFDQQSSGEQSYGQQPYSQQPLGSRQGYQNSYHENNSASTMFPGGQRGGHNGLSGDDYFNLPVANASQLVHVGEGSQLLGNGYDETFRDLMRDIDREFGVANDFQPFNVDGNDPFAAREHDGAGDGLSGESNVEADVANAPQPAQAGADNGSLASEQTRGYSDSYGGSLGSYPMTSAFQPQMVNVNQDFHTPANTSGLGNDRLAFTQSPLTQKPLAEPVTDHVADVRDPNIHPQSQTFSGPSFPYGQLSHNTYQSPYPPHFPGTSMNQMAGGHGYTLPPNHSNFVPNLLFSGSHIPSAVPGNTQAYPPARSSGSFTRVNANFRHWQPPSTSEFGRRDFEPSVPTKTSRSRGQRATSKKVAPSKRKAPSTPQSTSSQMAPLSPSGREAAAQGSAEVDKPTPATTAVAENEESEREEGPPKKTRKRKTNIKAALASGEMVTPTLRMVNGKVPETPYQRSAGIREPVPEKKKASGLYFDTHNEAQAGTAKLNWMPPKDDDSVPQNDEELRSHVLNLREAMKDMSSYIGRPGSKMKNRWLPADWTEDMKPKEGDVLDNPYYPAHWLERLAWDIAKICQRLHQEGPDFIDCHDPLFLEHTFEFKDLTFADRMDRLVAACRQCKDRVGAMLKLGTGAIYQYILSPDDLVQNSKSNRQNNDIRQKRLKETATKRKREVVEEEEA